MRKFLRILLICIVLLSAIWTACLLKSEEADDAVYDNLGQYLGTQEIVVAPDDMNKVFEYQIEYDWDELKATNKAITGWIYIPDNEYINFPVVQGTNNSYYLNHDYTGKWNANGAAFVDYRYTNLCLNKVIYAHNMSRSDKKPMFTSLREWKSEEYFQSHRVVYYTEASGLTKKYLVVGVCGFDVGKEKDFSYLDMSFETKEQLDAWVEYIKNHSLYFDLDDNEIDYCADEVMTLSTCDSSYGYRNGKTTGRLVLFCINLTNNDLRK